MSFSYGNRVCKNCKIEVNLKECVEKEIGDELWYCCPECESRIELIEEYNEEDRISELTYGRDVKDIVRYGLDEKGERYHEKK
jgi:hypothetical protein